MTTSWMCRTCAVETTPADTPPERCPVCDDPRQYVPRSGQPWTTVDELVGESQRVSVEELEADLFGIGTEPGTGIGQTALLARTSGGNLLWDVPGLIDDEAVARVRELGGVAAIMASHPHMYGVQSRWSAAFDDAPIYVAAKDAAFCAHRPDAVRLWDETFEVLPGITASQPGGHFPGSAIAHWTAPDGKGVLFTGDTVAVNPYGWSVSFLRSYPNKLPLSAAVVQRVADHVLAYDFDRVYDNFEDIVPADAHRVVAESADRYISWVNGEHDDET